MPHAHKVRADLRARVFTCVTALDPGALLDRVYDDVAAFSTGMPQGDDITMMIVKRS